MSDVGALPPLDPFGALKPEDVALITEWANAGYRQVVTDPLNFGPPPHRFQEQVHTSDTHLTLMIAANRLGKSYCGMRETLWRALGTHPYKDIRADMCWVGFPDYKFYVRTTMPTFRALVPQDRIIQFHETEKWVTLRRDDGTTATIFFMSYESGRDTWQGAAVDFIWLDEECPEDIYREALARLIDRRGDMLITQTPVSGMGWLYDRLYLPALSNPSSGVTVVQAALASRDSRRELDVGESLVPHLTREQILRFAQGIPDPDERSIRIFGEFRARSGVVYKQYKPEVHVIPAFDVPSHWEVWAGVDSGYHGFAVVFFAMSPDGRVYVVDEYFSQEEVIRVRAAAIWEKAQRFQAVRGEYLILYVDTADPQMVRELNLWSSEHGKSLAFKSLDMGKKAREAGVTRVQELLSTQEKRATPSWVKRERPPQGEPVLYFFDSLSSTWRINDELVEGQSRVIWEIMRYLWKKPKEGAPHPSEPDGDSAGGAHAMDAMRYGIMARIGAPEQLADDKYKDAGPDRWVWEQLDAELEGYEDDE